MKNKLSLSVLSLLSILHLAAQPESKAGAWKTWFIGSVKQYNLPAPPSASSEKAIIISKQKNWNEELKTRMFYWNAGPPGYRWYEMMQKLWTSDTGRYGGLANMLLGTSIYDATIAAWKIKYEYNRPRPFAADKQVQCFGPKPESPSYPCEYSVAAGVAAAVFLKFYPALADSVNKMAANLMEARIAAGLAFPSDTRAGFDLGKAIAEKCIALTKDYVNKEAWDGKIPAGPDKWRGRFAMLPMAGKNKTAVLISSSQFRPGPPPDYTGEMKELQSFKSTYRSLSNAFNWANQDFWNDYLKKKVFENNLHLNPPQAARLFAITSVGYYDGFVSCWDAKYTYWGIRPNQYDTSYHPPIIVTPPFPGYPSGHAVISGVMCELLSYFFPEDKTLFIQKAKEAAESRFQAGIHFRTDNDRGLEMGRKAGSYIVQQITEKGDGNALSTKQ